MYISLLFITVIHALNINGTFIPNKFVASPFDLPISTRVHLENGKLHLRSPIYAATSQFDFEVPDTVPASYVLRVTCRDYKFARYRVEVNDTDTINVYKDILGTEFTRRYEQAYPVELQAIEAYDHSEPGKPSITSFLKNPMIWLGVVMVFSLFGIPALTKYLDPEGMAEMERIKAERKKQGPGEKKDNPVQNLQDFDVSGWLAGKKKKTN